MAEPLRDRLVRLALTQLALLLQDAFGGLEPSRDVQPRGGGEVAQRVVAHGARPLCGAPPAHRPAKVCHVPAGRREKLVGLLEPATERQEEQPNDRQQQAEGQHPQERHRAVVLQDAGERHPILFGALAVLEHAIRVGVSGPVLDTCARRHEHLPAGKPRPPAQVDRIAIEPVVVQAESLPDIPGDEHRAPVYREDLEYAVELPLIDLPGLQRRHRVAETIDRPPDVAQRSRVFEIHDLRADDPDPLSSLQRGRFDEVRDGVRVQHGVAV